MMLVILLIIFVNKLFAGTKLPVESISDPSSMAHDYFRSQLSSNNGVHGWKETMIEVLAWLNFLLSTNS